MSELKKHRETLNFTGLSGYYGAMSAHQGYGGFDYSGMVEYLNTSYIFQEWCGNGYVSVAAATGASAIGYIFQSGAFESANLDETFSLKSMIAASAWNTNQEWQIATYTYSGGLLHLKGSENVYLNQSASTVRLGQLGKNICAFSIVLENVGGYGTSCGYGPSTGYQLAFGNMKIVWNGKIPHSGHELQGETPHARHHVTPNPINANAGTPAHHAQHGSASASHHGDAAWHTQLLAFGHEPGSLTADFRLPQTEHFGT